MKARCYNAKASGYDRYGAHGITICDEWRDSFEAFFLCMGPKPSTKHSIDRIDNSKGYEPGNCRWATPTQQSRNRSRVSLVWDDVVAIRAAAGAGVRGSVLAEKYGVRNNVIYRIIRRETWQVPDV
jgi:hypothetical protein